MQVVFGMAVNIVAFEARLGLSTETHLFWEKVMSS